MARQGCVSDNAVCVMRCDVGSGGVFVVVGRVHCNQYVMTLNSISNSSHQRPQRCKTAGSPEKSART